MIKLNYILAAFALLFFSTSLWGQKDDPIPIEPYAMGQIMQQKFLDEKLEDVVADLTDIELWSNTIYTDSLLEIVYIPEDFNGDIVEDDLIYDIKSPKFVAAKDEIINLVLQNNTQKSKSDVIYYEDDEDPLLILRVDSYSTVNALRNSKNIHSIGTGGLMNEKYENDFRNGINSLPEKNQLYLKGLQEDSNVKNKGIIALALLWILDTINFGCGNSAAPEDRIRLVYDNPIDDEEPVLRVPWHYEAIDVIKANRCFTGAGVKIALLDSGVSENQENLGDKFNNPYNDREIIKRTVFSDGDTDDDCGHGTHMAGVIAGPQYNSAVRGVAYESDLVSMRSNKDVLLLSIFSKLKLKKAMKVIRKGWHGTGGVKIMSMSLGYLNRSLGIAFELKKLDKKGVLMFAAIGTSPKEHESIKGIQVYPAKSKRTVGVTGVFRKEFTTQYEFCEECHYGDKVRFIVPMQYNYGIKTHSLMEQGDAPSKVGGSSIATATMAGVAALVWSMPENQDKSDEEITAILAANTFPNSGGGYFGFGVVDVAKATKCTAPDPETVIQIEDVEGTPSSNFTICEDVYLNPNGSIYEYAGVSIRLEWDENGEPMEAFVNTSMLPPFPGPIPRLNISQIFELEIAGFSFIPGQTYEITFGINDVTFGWHYDNAQFTIQQVPVSGVLPVSGSHTYNYGVESASIIASREVNAGGILRVNDSGITGFIPGSGPPTTQSTFYAEVKEYCNGLPQVITVNDGGQFILGSGATDPVSRKAIVNVRSGNTVHIKSGGRLRLTRGSQLIIDEGAKLIIEEGANVDLWWSESTIWVKGELDLKGEFKFGGSGFFQFDDTHTLTLTSVFNLEGQSLSHRFLRLNDGTTLDIDGYDLNLNKGTVEYGDHTKINIGQGGNVTTFLNSFTAMEPNSFYDNIGLQLNNPSSVDIKFTYFEDLDIGILANSLVGTNDFTVSNSWFNNNSYGINANNGSDITIQATFFEAMNKGQNGIELRNISSANLNSNRFSDYPLTFMGAMNLINVDDALVSYCAFADNGNSVRLENVLSYVMKGGTITNPSDIYSSDNLIGIEVPLLDGWQANMTNVFLTSNAQIKHQKVGIYVAKGGHNDGPLYGRVSLDCAKLINNGTSIKGEDVTLEIDAFVHCDCTDITDARPNTFIRSAAPQGGGEKHFDICYDQLSVSQVLANGNYWSDLPASNGYDIENCNSSNDIPLITDIQATVEPTSCSTGGNDPAEIKDRSDSTSPSELSHDGTASMSIYPNPTNGQFSIMLNPGKYTIRIFDLTGKEVFQQASMDANSQLDSRGWPRGLYFVQAIEQSTQVRSQVKLIVQ